MKLMICGNGMDLHLGFKTSYRAYRDFLNEAKFIQGKRAVTLVENSKFFVSRDTDCWSDLENALTFDVQKYIKEILWAYDRDMESCNEEQSRQQIEAATEFEKNDPERIAFDFINDWFFEWIGKEYYDNEKQIKAEYDGILRKIFKNDECVFVNFNYTPTLESVFGIDESKILYIHNRFPYKPTLPFTANDIMNDIFETGKKKFQFGSIDNKLREGLRHVKQITLQSEGKLISKKDIEGKIERIYSSLSKNLEENYERLEKFVSQYKIDEIVVIGHSFMGIDEAYYRDVLVPLLKNCKWIFFCHGSRDYAQIFVEKYNITKYKMIDW